MKKLINMISDGLQKKTVLLVLLILIVTVAESTAFSAFQRRSLTKIVADTRDEQQQAITDLSEETMESVMTDLLGRATVLQSKLADNDFNEIINDAYILQSMAQSLIEKKDSIVPYELSLPDPEKDGTLSAMVLTEEGVDYRDSQYLGIIGHLSRSMIAMCRNSSKIEGCFIGLEDGTHLSISSHTLNRLDETGNVVPFPVRQRPWYVGAAETKGLYFTGIEKDAFSGLPCITCSAPIMMDGELIGVIGIDIILSTMNDYISSSHSESGFAFIVNHNGQVILAPESNGFFEVTTADKASDLRKSDNRELAQFITTALHEDTELSTVRLGEKEYYMSGSPMPSVGWAYISLVDKEATREQEKKMSSEFDRINAEATEKFHEATNSTQQTSRLVITLIFILSVCAAMIAAANIVRPLVAMTNTIRANSKTDDPFEMKDLYRTGDEIEVLAEAFADLSRKTKQYIKDITVITQEKERVNSELNMANQIQTSMLPHTYPAFPDRKDFDICALMDPAREVGGDFYDYFLIDDDHLCMVIADVSGKGIPAALFMMSSKIILQNSIMLGKPISEVLEVTNNTLCSGNQAEMFITVWIGILELSTGKLTAANAGHEYPALMQDGTFRLLKDSHSFVVGGMEDVEYQEYELLLKPGDRLFLYTDGVPEAADEDNRMFGTDRMLEALNRDPHASPKVILENVKAAVDEFVSDAEQFDDLTMLCLQYDGRQDS
ncbi:MAG: SpoIIE family protein phosphatase [Solobacterium sp.]|nr:SpoIIE family protein phosphatase [Solobacterium sp.]